eukprot:405655-Pyramimonas_sp.AAC.1
MFSWRTNQSHQLAQVSGARSATRINTTRTVKKSVRELRPGLTIPERIGRDPQQIRDVRTLSVLRTGAGETHAYNAKRDATKNQGWPIRTRTNT